MIEEIKLLVPLLADAGEGAFWLILAYLAKDVAIAGLWTGAGVAALYSAYRIAIVMTTPAANSANRSGSLRYTANAVRDLWLYNDGALPAGEARALHKKFEQLLEESKLKQ